VSNLQKKDLTGSFNDPVKKTEKRQDNQQNKGFKQTRRCARCAEYVI
jgi:hypothetical protein